MRKITKLFIVTLLACLIFAAGCSKLSQENYSKLKMGMEYSEVTDILGNPDGCSESIGAKSCTWGDKDRNITVIFLGDNTMGFSSTGIK